MHPDWAGGLGFHSLTKHLQPYLAYDIIHYWDYKSAYALITHLTETMRV